DPARGDILPRPLSRREAHAAIELPYRHEPRVRELRHLAGRHRPVKARRSLAALAILSLAGCEQGAASPAEDAAAGPPDAGSPDGPAPPNDSPMPTADAPMPSPDSPAPPVDALWPAPDSAWAGPDASTAALRSGVFVHLFEWTWPDVAAECE